MDASHQPYLPGDEISLLGLLLTVSQNIKLLIFGPLTAGTDPVSAAKLAAIRRALGLTGSRPV